VQLRRRPGRGRRTAGPAAAGGHGREARQDHALRHAGKPTGPNRTGDRRLPAAELPARWQVDAPTEHDASRHAASWGIPFPTELLAADAAEALALAGRLRWPIVAKQLCRDLPHKSDLGLVRPGIRDRRELAAQLAQLDEVVAGSGLEPAGILLAEQATGATAVDASVEL
jgi:acyl-CoA synthetase (NDP forming)